MFPDSLYNCGFMGTKIKIDWPASWLGDYRKPLVIAGPCSAESQEQVLQTARRLCSIPVKVFRAGIWKPRTRPGSFEGVGNAGLKWLCEVKRQTGMLVATEIANSRHAEEALGAGIDVVWIGARTTVNPFAVQEIAEALRGRDLPILVKNPMNPDVELWIGAIERLYGLGQRKIVAVHRGFSSGTQLKYRNPPQWQIPIELKRRIPSLPLLADPSHMGGARSLILELSQKAMDLNFDGLFVESHADPERALSDAGQQVTPEELSAVLKGIVVRTSGFADRAAKYSLQELRAQIDRLDRELIDILGRRMRIADRIGRIKKAANMTILQSARWSEIVRQCTRLGRERDLSPDFVFNVLKEIHQESINRQTEIYNCREGVEAD